MAAAVVAKQRRIDAWCDAAVIFISLLVLCILGIGSGLVAVWSTLPLLMSPEVAARIY